MNWVISLSLVVAFELIADIFAKEWSLGKSDLLWFGTIVAYVVATVFWLSALKNGSGLGKGVVLFSVASAILATLVGIFFYKEVATKIQLVGILLGLLSLIFIFW